MHDAAVADTADIDRNSFTIPFDTKYGRSWMWIAHRIPGRTRSTRQPGRRVGERGRHRRGRRHRRTSRPPPTKAREDREIERGEQFLGCRHDVCGMDIRRTSASGAQVRRASVCKNPGSRETPSFPVRLVAEIVGW